ncbi:hypothetical protein Q8G71_35255, partial [Klebsiella pneumoniae]
IAKDVFLMQLYGNTENITRPGQFIHIELPGFFLRRPISVCDLNGYRLTIIYKIFGEGTQYMSTLPVGTILDALTGLGNGFDTEKSGAE